MTSNFGTWLRGGSACAIIVLLVAATVAHAQTPRQLGPAASDRRPGSAEYAGHDV